MAGKMHRRRKKMISGRDFSRDLKNVISIFSCSRNMGGGISYIVTIGVHNGTINNYIIHTNNSISETVSKTLNNSNLQLTATSSSSALVSTPKSTSTSASASQPVRVRVPSYDQRCKAATSN
jgi:hypothetical protein